MQINQPLFSLGRIVATPGILAKCKSAHMTACLSQHMCGNWGELCEEDKQANVKAVTNGSRILSVYPIDPLRPADNSTREVFWIITEADRSVTTFLLPEEY